MKKSSPHTVHCLMSNWKKKKKKKNKKKQKKKQKQRWRAEAKSRWVLISSRIKMERKCMCVSCFAFCF